MITNKFDILFNKLYLEEKQDYINVWPYMIQFKNFNDSTSQLKVIRQIVNILNLFASRYEIDIDTIVHRQHKSLPATYCIQWEASKYVQPLNIWNNIYNQLLKSDTFTQNKWIFWKSLLPNKDPKAGYFRPGEEIEKKLGDKFKPTRLQVYFNQRVQIKLQFDNVQNFPQAQINDDTIKKYIDNKLEKIENLSIIKKKLIKKHGINSLIYIIKYQLKDQTEFSDLLSKALGTDWHPEGNGYSFDYTFL